MPNEKPTCEKTNLSYLCKLSLDQNTSWSHLSSVSFYKGNYPPPGSLAGDFFPSYSNPPSFSYSQTWFSAHRRLWYETRSRSYFSQHNTYFNHILASPAFIFSYQFFCGKEEKITSLRGVKRRSNLFYEIATLRSR